MSENGQHWHFLSAPVDIYSLISFINSLKPKDIQYTKKLTTYWENQQIFVFMELKPVTFEHFYFLNGLKQLLKLISCQSTNYKTNYFSSNLKTHFYTPQSHITTKIQSNVSSLCKSSDVKIQATKKAQLFIYISKENFFWRVVPFESVKLFMC